MQRIEDDLAELFFGVFGPGVRHNRGDHFFRLPNGAFVELAQIEDQRSYLKHQGRETTLLCIDELTNFATDRFVNLLRSNLRAPGDIPLRVVVTGNPGGPLHAKVARGHVHGRTAWRPYEHSDGSMWVTCPSVYTDNPHLDHARYARDITAAVGSDRALSEAWLSGRWDDIAGAFFAGTFGAHCIIPEAEWHVPREGWWSYVSMDWGMSAPSVVLLCARPLRPGLSGPGARVFPKQSLVVVDEIAVCDPNDPTVGLGWPPQMLAEEILSRCKRWNIRPRGIGDDARGLDGSTLLEQFRRFGVSMQRPTKDRISGWVAVKQMMAAASGDDPDQPGLFIAERCRYLLETLPTLPRNQLRPEDVDTNAADHGADALRYAVVTKPMFSRISRARTY